MAGLGAPEIVLIIVVLVLLFGAKKLPDLARGSGRALRIFKAETKGLTDDEEESTSGNTDKQLPPSNQSPQDSDSSDASQSTRDQQQS